MERLAHIATVSGVQFVNERARRPFESVWRLSSIDLLEAFRLIFGHLAQLVEQPEEGCVVGSSPTLASYECGILCKFERSLLLKKHSWRSGKTGRPAGVA